MNTITVSPFPPTEHELGCQCTHTHKNGKRCKNWVTYKYRVLTGTRRCWRHPDPNEKPDFPIGLYGYSGGEPTCPHCKQKGFKFTSKRGIHKCERCEKEFEWEQSRHTLWSTKPIPSPYGNTPRDEYYPESDKLLMVSEFSQTCGEFIAWLADEKKIHLGEYADHSNGEMWPSHRSITSLLAEFFEIDPNKVEQEKRAILAKLQAQAVKKEGN